MATIRWRPILIWTGICYLAFLLGAGWLALHRVAPVPDPLLPLINQ